MTSRLPDRSDAVFAEPSDWTGIEATGIAATSLPNDFHSVGTLRASTRWELRAHRVDKLMGQSGDSQTVPMPLLTPMVKRGDQHTGVLGRQGKSAVGDDFNESLDWLDRDGDVPLSDWQQFRPQVRHSKSVSTFTTRRLT